MFQSKRICKTGTGELRKVTKHGKAFALKIFNKQDEHSKDNPLKEIELLKLLREHRHPSLSHSVDEGVFDTNKWVLLSFFEHGDLFSFVQKENGLSISQTTTVTTQVCYGLKHLRRFGRIHGDVSLENILISSIHPLQIKLCDFGLTAKVNEIRSTCGKRAYMPLEMHLHSKIKAKSSQDVFALGVTIWTMLFNSFPFSETTTNRYRKLFQCCEIHNSVLEWGYDIDKLNSKVYKLAIQMMQPSPLNRPPLSRILSRLT